MTEQPRIIAKLKYISKAKTGVLESDPKRYFNYINGKGIYEDNAIVAEASLIKYGKYTIELIDEINDEMKNFESNGSLERAEYEQYLFKVINRSCKRRGLDQSLGQLHYQEYISNRSGSNGVFSYNGANVSELKYKLMQYEGAIYLPIISMKESDAQRVGLTDLKHWKYKTRILVTEFSKIMNWKVENVNYLCAFHQKTGDQINTESTAGNQPHIHLMVWNDDSTVHRSFERLTPGELKKLRQKTSSVFLGDWYYNDYQKNDFEKRGVKSEFEDLVESKFTEDLVELKISTSYWLGGQGRLSATSISNQIDILTHILERKKNRQPTTIAQNDYLAKKNLDRVSAIENTLRQLIMIDDGYKKLIDVLLKNNKIEPLYQDWLENKRRSTLGWASEDESFEESEKADGALKTSLYNSLLNISKKWYSVSEIKPEIFDCVMDKLSHHAFHSAVSDDDAYNMCKPIIRVLMYNRKSEKEIHSFISNLLNGSLKQFSSTQLVGDIRECTRENRREDLIVSKFELFQTLNAISYNPVDWVSYNMENYGKPYRYMNNKINSFFWVENPHDKKYREEHKFVFEKEC